MVCLRKWGFILVLFACSINIWASALTELESGEFYIEKRSREIISVSNTSDQELYIQAPPHWHPIGLSIPEKTEEGHYILTVKPKYGHPETSFLMFKETPKALKEIPEFMYDLEYSTVGMNSLKKISKKELRNYITVEGGVLRVTSGHDLYLAYYPVGERTQKIFLLKGEYRSVIHTDEIESDLGYKKGEVPPFRIFMKTASSFSIKALPPAPNDAGVVTEEDILNAISDPDYLNSMALEESLLPMHQEWLQHIRREWGVNLDIAWVLRTFPQLFLCKIFRHHLN